MRIDRTLQPFPLAGLLKEDSCSARLEVKLESMEGENGKRCQLLWLNKSVGSLSGICSASNVDAGRQ